MPGKTAALRGVGPGRLRPARSWKTERLGQTSARQLPAGNAHSLPRINAAAPQPAGGGTTSPCCPPRRSPPPAQPAENTALAEYADFAKLELAPRASWPLNACPARTALRLQISLERRACTWWPALKSSITSRRPCPAKPSTAANLKPARIRGANRRACCWPLRGGRHPAWSRWTASCPTRPGEIDHAGASAPAPVTR